MWCRWWKNRWIGYRLNVDRAGFGKSLNSERVAWLHVIARCKYDTVAFDDGKATSEWSKRVQRGQIQCGVVDVLFEKRGVMANCA